MGQVTRGPESEVPAWAYLKVLSVAEGQRAIGSRAYLPCQGASGCHWGSGPQHQRGPSLEELGLGHQTDVTPSQHVTMGEVS